MQLRLSIVCLLALTILPLQGWADEVWVVGDTSMPAITTANNTSSYLPIIAGMTTTSAGLDAQLNYQMHGPLGDTLAMSPGFAGSNAAISAKTQHKTNATQARIEELKGALQQDAIIFDVNPQSIMKFFEDLRSGDMESQLREKMQTKWQSVKDELAAKFSKEAMAASMQNLITDLLNCRTPQLDVLFPSINLGLGLAMCDYGQLFNNMKDQVDNLVDRGWGGQFKINGRELRDYLKDPSLLKEAVHLVPPGQGHRMVFDFLSDQSINASFQAKIDANSWAEQLAQMDKNRTLMRLFKPRTMLDAQDENTDAVVKSSAINNALMGQQLQNSATGLQMDALRFQREEQLRQEQEFKENAQDIAGSLKKGSF